jgi:hypothetical protein
MQIVLRNTAYLIVYSTRALCTRVRRSLPTRAKTNLIVGITPLGWEEEV